MGHLFLMLSRKYVLEAVNLKSGAECAIVHKKWCLCLDLGFSSPVLARVILELFGLNCWTGLSNL